MGAGQAGISGPEQRILDALAWWESIGVTTPDNSSVAFIAEYSPTSSSYRNPRSRLKSGGLIDYPSDGVVTLTTEGRRVAVVPEVPPSRTLLHEKILAKCDGAMTRLLRPLIEAYPHGLTNEALAAKAGYSETSSSYRNPRSRLKTLGLVEYVAGGVRASDLLFPEGVPA